MNKVIVFVLIVIVCGCSNGNNSMEQYGFNTVEELDFHLINLNDDIFKPTAIEIFDSLMLVYDPIEDCNYKIYNIETLKPIISGCKKGEGPNDILYGQFIDKINSNCFQVTDPSSRKILIYNIDSIIKQQTFNPIANISYETFANKILDENIGVLYHISDSLNVGLGPFKEGKYISFGNNVSFEFGHYPEELVMESHPFYLHQGALQINSEKNIFLYHSPIGYYYEIYKYENGKYVRVMQEYKNIEHINDASTENTIMGICSADFSSEYIYLLYSGRTMKEYPDDAYFADNILVINDIGDKIKCFKTNRSNLYISVDSVKGRIYSISKNPESDELEIGYYKVKSL